MSNKSDLATYQFQLGQVEEALVKDPENVDLLKLQSDLLELVNLYTTLVSQEETVFKPVAVIKPQKPIKPVEKEEKKESSDLVVGHVEEKKIKKKYVPKKERKPSKRDLELNQKQSDWQSFTSKKPKLSMKKATFSSRND